MTKTRKIVVELTQGGRQVEYCEVTLAEAKDILARKMVNGFAWQIPSWQFDNDGGTPEDTLQERQAAAYAAVRQA